MADQQVAEPAIVRVTINGEGVDVPIPRVFYTGIHEGRDNPMDLGQVGTKQGLRPLWAALGGPVGVVAQNATRPVVPRGPGYVRRQKAKVRAAILAIIARNAPAPAARPSNPVVLPIYRLREMITATRTQPVFLLGEPVRLWNSTPDADGNVAIVDYEGHIGFVPMDVLIPPRRPWGLILDSARVPAEFLTTGTPLLTAWRDGVQVVLGPLPRGQEPRRPPPGSPPAESPAPGRRKRARRGAASRSPRRGRRRRRPDNINTAGAAGRPRNGFTDDEILDRIADLDSPRAREVIDHAGREAGYVTGNFNLAFNVDYEIGRQEP
ncbi:uncharacterized protein LY89DRAFT_281742 [Mollisia scopiformis]|uniref:Uncharacterized protein n=1 Tax=Mollisia scopiformis TaxID=149040 RepID=A0A132BA22_MOLSC|nr:uncharacterized protein LY89DRAFT_281742 [Mollisia scopiformis]KUJ09252.1 hypothetical protein LY89DRAFT_281742 [Mollisia scopiformis]